MDMLPFFFFALPTERVIKNHLAVFGFVVVCNSPRNHCESWTFAIQMVIIFQTEKDIDHQFSLVIVNFARNHQNPFKWYPCVCWMLFNRSINMRPLIFCTNFLDGVWIQCNQTHGLADYKFTARRELYSYVSASMQFGLHNFESETPFKLGIGIWSVIAWCHLTILNWALECFSINVFDLSRSFRANFERTMCIS